MDTWTNGACLGYIIAALERLDYPQEKIQEIVDEIKYNGFELTTVEEADEYYSQSSY